MRPTNGTPPGAVNTFRVVIPLALIVIGILAIAGCIYVPVAEHPHTPSGQDVRRVVGDRASDKPLKVGVATRDTVLRLLGAPKLRTRHDVAIGYDCRTIAGHYFGLCVFQSEREAGHHIFFAPANVWAHHLLFLEFDQNGLLKRHQLSRIEPGWDVLVFERAWKVFIQTVPDEPIEPPEKQRATTKP